MMINSLSNVRLPLFNHRRYPRKLRALLSGMFAIGIALDYYGAGECPQRVGPTDAPDALWSSLMVIRMTPYALTHHEARACG
jgi:hypothetical protein